MKRKRREEKRREEKKKRKEEKGKEKEREKNLCFSKPTPWALLKPPSKKNTGSLGKSPT